MKYCTYLLLVPILGSSWLVAQPSSEPMPEEAIKAYLEAVILNDHSVHGYGDETILNFRVSRDGHALELSNDRRWSRSDP